MARPRPALHSEHLAGRAAIRLSDETVAGERIPHDAPTPMLARLDAARSTVRDFASVVDRENRFPRESFEALREAGLLTYFAPVSAGGPGGTAREYTQIATRLGADCLSTAINWAMHTQQIAVIAGTAFDGREALLRHIVTTRPLIASVTSEYGKGGDLMRADAPLEERDDGFHVVRRAPVVSYGAEAGLYLMTMRHPAREEPVLVCVARGDGEVLVEGEWHAMGMRGTQSVPMRFDAMVRRTRLIDVPFRDVAAQTMVPIGHLGWAAAWAGAAQGLFYRTVRHLRARAAEGRLDTGSDALRRRLAEIQVSLDLATAMVAHAAVTFDALRAQRADVDRYREPAFVTLINSLKIGVSRLAFGAAHELVGVCGLFDGYLEGGAIGADRVFRDLRSAELMYSNERLLQANGALAFTLPGP